MTNGQLFSALDRARFSLDHIVQALKTTRSMDVATLAKSAKSIKGNIKASLIAEALKFSEFCQVEIAGALKSEFNLDRKNSEATLKSLRYKDSQIQQALNNVYGDSGSSRK